MIDYIFIVLAVVCFAAQFAFTGMFEKCVRQTTVTVLIMLVVTNAIGMLLFLLIGGFKIGMTAFSFLWALAFAIVMIPYYMLGIKVLSFGSLAVYSMFMMLGGMLVPFFYGVVFLQEDVSAAKAVGCVLLSISIILQALWQKQPEGASSPKAEHGKISRLFFILCLAVFVINGLTGVIAKAHQLGTEAVDEVSFTVISCSLTAVISAVMLIVKIIASEKHKITDTIRAACSKKAFPLMAAIGISAYTGNFLHLKAAANVPASVQFPLVSGGVIILSTLVSAIFFKEKISKGEWISIFGAFLSTFLFAF